MIKSYKCINVIAPLLILNTNAYINILSYTALCYYNVFLTFALVYKDDTIHTFLKYFIRHDVSLSYATYVTILITKK